MTDRRRVGVGERVLSAAIAAACLGVLLIAASLSVDPDGHGTHTQLGLPACGWAMTLNAPCPTCGMTTSFTAFADARPIAAFLTQPFGAFLAIVAAGVFWGGVWAAVTGDRIGAIYLRLLRPPLLWSLGGAATAAWAYKLLTWD